MDSQEHFLDKEERIASQAMRFSLVLTVIFTTAVFRTSGDILPNVLSALSSISFILFLVSTGSAMAYARIKKNAFKLKQEDLISLKDIRG
jgi:hypothetical protein